MILTRSTFIKFFSAIFTLGLTFNLFSATYLPISVEEQLQSSNAIVFGKYKSKIYGILPSGKVSTFHTIDVQNYTGLKTNELLNLQAFRFITPGGTWQGVEYKELGVPKFKKDEEVVLILKRGRYGMELNNLALGKYSVITDKGINYLQSYVFPHHPVLGQISITRFNMHVEDVLGARFVSRKSNNHNFIKAFDNDKNSGRAPASIKEEKEDETFFEMFWLVVIFMGLGLFSSVILGRSTKKR